MSKKLKTPISYYGGKQTLLPHILPEIPKHKVYTEAFAGGAAVFFAKEPSEVEVLNDVNGMLVNFYRVLKSDFINLKQRIDSTLHSREEHEYAMIIYQFPRFFCDVEKAWALWVLSKQSFASKLDGSWGYDKARNTIGKKIDNARLNFLAELSERLRWCQIESTDGLRIIQSRDTIDAFHFVDPPYVGTDCGHYSGSYNLLDFKNLLELLSNINGKFMLTMFPHDLLQQYIDKNNWRVIERIRTISASKTSRRKQAELLVMNY